MGQWPANRLRAAMPIGDLEEKRDFTFTDIRGFHVLNTTGHKVGSVKEIYVDPNTLEPCFAFLRYEKFMNFNTKHFLVPWEELRVGSDYVQTRWTEEELLPDTVAHQQRHLAEHDPGSAGRRDLAFDTEEEDDDVAVTRAMTLP